MKAWRQNQIHWHSNKEVKEDNILYDKAFFQSYVIWLLFSPFKPFFGMIQWATFICTVHVPIHLSPITLPVSSILILIIRNLSCTSLLLWIIFSWITVTISAFWWFPTFVFMFLFLFLFMRLQFSVPFSLFFMTGILTAFIWISFTCCGLIK